MEDYFHYSFTGQETSDTESVHPEEPHEEVEETISQFQACVQEVIIFGGRGVPYIDPMDT